MKKRLIPALLSVIFVLSGFLTITAFAACPASRDGLTATLSTGKSIYSANENIDMSLTVTNNNAYAVDGIQTAITLPDGVTAKAGSLTQNAFALAAGESRTSTLSMMRAVTITLPKDDTTTSPQTGDSADIAIWLTMMLASAGILVFLVIKNKKINNKGALSIFLCFVILGTIGLSISANAATAQKSFTVTKDIVIDGKAVAVSAEISYGYVAHYPVTVTDGTGSAVYTEDDTVTITANAAQRGYHFKSWAVVSGGATLANEKDITTTFIMPDRAVEVKANYEINSYTITATTGSNGAVSPQGTIAANHGDSKKFDFAANNGYHIKGVIVDGTDIGAVPSYTFDNATGNHTMSVIFAKDTYTVTVNNGTVQGGTTTVAWGETVTIEADTPDTDMLFVGWTVERGIVLLSDEKQASASFIMPQSDVELTANEAADNYKRLLSAKIRYQFGNTYETLTADDIRSIVSANGDGTYTVSAENARKYVDRLASKYNTWGKARRFIAHTGNTISVAGGDYGYLIDRAAETTSLIKRLEAGIDTTCEPIYAQRAITRGDLNDIGNTYIEINLEVQHLWFYVNGKKIIDADIVSDKKGYDTRTGVHQITCKEQNVNVNGVDYKYWMPFMYSIGICDSDPSRTSFGGDIYSVGVPLECAELIFNNITNGCPVIIYAIAED